MTKKNFFMQSSDFFHDRMKFIKGLSASESNEARVVLSGILREVFDQILVGDSKKLLIPSLFFSDASRFGPSGISNLKEMGNIESFPQFTSEYPVGDIPRLVRMDRLGSFDNAQDPNDFSIQSGFYSALMESSLSSSSDISEPLRPPFYNKEGVPYTVLMARERNTFFEILRSTCDILTDEQPKNVVYFIRAHLSNITLHLQNDLDAFSQLAVSIYLDWVTGGARTLDLRFLSILDTIEQIVTLFKIIVDEMIDTDPTLPKTKSLRRSVTFDLSNEERLQIEGAKVRAALWVNNEIQWAIDRHKQEQSALLSVLLRIGEAKESRLKSAKGLLEESLFQHE